MPFRSWQDDNETVLTPGQRPIWWLAWATAPYALTVRLRASAYARGWVAQKRLPVPVISVGNLTVGGTGKTPIVIEITQWLLGAGKRVAVLSRGYRRTSRERLLIVSDGSRILATPQDAGDEPYLIAQRCPMAVVAVGADRFQLGRRILENRTVDYMVLDDGFQHLGLHRDVNLLLVDATDVAGMERLLPAGRLREPLSAAGRASAVIVTRADQTTKVEEMTRRLRSTVNPLPPMAQVVFRATEVVSVVTGTSRSPDWTKGKRAVLVSGVAHTASFRDAVAAMGVTILEEAAYPDHHPYSANDVSRVQDRATRLHAELVLTTEKDAPKIQPYLERHEARWWAPRLSVQWLTGEAVIRGMIMDARAASGEGVRV